jgi:hypothetical protein
MGKRVAGNFNVRDHRREGNEGAPAMAEPSNPVTVIDVRVPFWRLVVVLLKLALAAIPASILFILIVWGTVAILRVIGFGLMVGSMRV